MNAVSPVLVLFFLMLTGFLTAKVKLCNSEMARHFSTLVIYISLPALLFSSFLRPFSWELLREGGLAFGLTIIVYGLAFLISIIYPRILGIKSPERGVHRYALIISNCGFMGYPMVEAILGPAYLFHAVIFNIPFNFLAFSLCAWLISKEGSYSMKIDWKVFLNPNVIATCLGLFFFIFSLGVPDPIYRSLRMVGDITSPLSMIVIGINLAQANIRQVFGRWQVYVTVAMRLLILPVLISTLFYLFGLRGPLLIMAALITAMPAGSSTSILASLYRTAEEEASSLVFLSTSLCMVTIPLIIFISGFFS